MYEVEPYFCCLGFLYTDAGQFYTSVVLYDYSCCLVLCRVVLVLCCVGSCCLVLSRVVLCCNNFNFKNKRTYFFLFYNWFPLEFDISLMW